MMRGLTQGDPATIRKFYTLLIVVNREAFADDKLRKIPRRHATIPFRRIWERASDADGNSEAG